MVNLCTELEESCEGTFTYYPGHMLRGSVELSLTSPLKIRGLNVTVYGRAKTYWSENESKIVQFEDGTYEDQFNGKEVYIESTKYVLGQQYGPYNEIAAGVHKYNFEFKLPEHLPNSISTPHGDISYFVITTLETPDQPNIEGIARFSIKRNDDIKLIPKLQVPFEKEYICHFCCLFCKSMPIFITATVPRTGFNSGEKIPIEINYVNISHRNVTKTVIKLKQTHTYHCDTPKINSKEVVEIITRSEIPGVKKRSTKLVEEYLQIPYDLKSSNDNFSSYIRISYHLTIRMDIKEPNGASQLIVPITIGTTPDYTYVQPPVPFVPVPSTTAPSAPEEQSIDNELPPSFDEAMKIQGVGNPLLQPLASNIGWSYS